MSGVLSSGYLSAEGVKRHPNTLMLSKFLPSRATPNCQTIRSGKRWIAWWSCALVQEQADVLARRSSCPIGCKSFRYVPYVEYIPNIVQRLKCLVVVAEQSGSTSNSIKIPPFRGNPLQATHTVLVLQAFI